MVLNIEEEDKRFIALKQREFVTELDKMYTNTSDYLVYHLNPSDER